MAQEGRIVWTAGIRPAGIAPRGGKAWRIIDEMLGIANGWLQRLGVFGDLPTRLLRRAVSCVPWFLEPFFIALWMPLFFLLAGSQRRAVAANLGHLFPGRSRVFYQLGALRVFWNFSWVCVESYRARHEDGGVDWLIDGSAAFAELAAERRGSIILTAHMGNYDMAAPVFSGRFGRTVYAVRAPERNPQLQEVRAAELREKERVYPDFRSLYNLPGNMLGVELARVLAAGGVVAIQGDRVLFDVAFQEVAVGEGLWMRVPKGPSALMRASGASCFPLFILRDGYRRYRIVVLPKLVFPPRQRGTDDLGATEVWAGALLEIVRTHWSQWFVFEEVFRSSREVAP